MHEPEWTEEAWKGLLALLAYIERTPWGDAELRADDVFAAVDALPGTWAHHRPQHRVGHIELRRVVTARGSLVVFSHEPDREDPDGVIVVRWVAHGHAEHREPPASTVRPREEMPRIRLRR